jgi:lysophospholipase L1-like esterase
MKIVCIGDSLTFGYGVFKNECWVNLIKNNCNLDIINKGVNGDTTAGMLSRSYVDVIQLKPTHVIIMAGCNDFMCGRKLNSVKNNLAELIKEALNHNIIPIIGIEPPIEPILAERKWSGDVDYNLVNNIEETYRDWIISLCINLKINFVDFYKCFKETLESKSPRDLYVDGIHPTSLGHKLMYEYVIDVFQAMKLLPE